MIVLDNSVLSAFKRLNKLSLIRDLFRDVAVPLGVYDEFVRGRGSSGLPKWVAVETLNHELIEEAEKINLGAGEAQAIVYAERKGCLLALDDEKAREEAGKRGVAIIGSVGILRIAYESCLIQTKELLRVILDKLSEDVYLENWLTEWVLQARKTVEGQGLQ